MARYTNQNTTSSADIFNLLLRYREMQKSDRRQSEMVGIQRESLAIEKGTAESQNALRKLQGEGLTQEMEFNKTMNPIREAGMKIQNSIGNAQIEDLKAGTILKRDQHLLVDVQLQDATFKLVDGVIGAMDARNTEYASLLGMELNRAEAATIEGTTSGFNSVVVTPIYQKDPTKGWSMVVPTKENQRNLENNKFRVEQLQKWYEEDSQKMMPISSWFEVKRQALADELEKVSDADAKKWKLDTPEGKAQFFYEKILLKDSTRNKDRGQLSALGSGKNKLDPGTLQVSGIINAFWGGAKEQAKMKRVLKESEEHLGTLKFSTGFKQELTVKMAELENNPKLTPQQRNLEINQFVAKKFLDRRAPADARNDVGRFLIEAGMMDAEDQVLRGVSPRDLDRVLGVDPSAANYTNVFGPRGTGVGVRVGMTNREVLQGQETEKEKQRELIDSWTQGGLTQGTLHSIRAEQNLKKELSKKAYELWLDSPAK